MNSPREKPSHREDPVQDSPACSLVKLVTKRNKDPFAETLAIYKLAVPHVPFTILWLYKFGVLHGNFKDSKMNSFKECY